MSLISRSTPWGVWTTAARAFPTLMAATPGSGLADGVGLAAFGVGVALAAGIADVWTTRDGIGALHRTAPAALSLILWLALFALIPAARGDRTTSRSIGPVAAAVVGMILGVATLDSLTSGAMWSVVAFAAIANVSAWMVARSRGAAVGGGALLIGGQVLTAAIAFAVVAERWAPYVAAALNGALLLALATGRAALPDALRQAVEEILRWGREIRPHLGPVVLAAVASAILVIVISGQVAVVGKALAPFVGLAVSRFVGEELLLRVWLLSGLQRRLGASRAVASTAVLSGLIGAVVWPQSLWLTGFVAGVTGGIAAGVLWNRTRCAPAVVLFRLLTW
ncbi:MAG: hypothetical protein NZ518_07825 [Dehalococcoidia bacterium]|nr:hypothetical protein [Dehalococcoidia bacterium]